MGNNKTPDRKSDQKFLMGGLNVISPEVTLQFAHRTHASKLTAGTRQTFFILVFPRSRVPRLSDLKKNKAGFYGSLKLSRVSWKAK